MGKKYLIDTNVLIDAQMNRLSSNGLDFLAKVINEDFMHIYNLFVLNPHSL